MTSRRKSIIRVDDRVRIIRPVVVVRVGYPKTVSDYLPEAEKKFRALLHTEGLRGRVIEKVLREIAYGLAKADGFGGRQRTLHIKEIPDILGQEFRVMGIRTVKTGIYYPPAHGRSGWYGEEYDYEPGGLSDEKTHRLVTGWHPPVFRRMMDPDIEIAVENLEKINEEPVPF